MSSFATRPMLYAHRGAAAERPENTLISFARALELGAHALEMDLHMTRDGVVVVSHDATGLRMAGVPGRISDCLYEDVRRWDAGHGFIDSAGGRPFAGRGVRFPTLEEVLVEYPGVPLNVDIKQHQPPLVPALLALLRRLDAADRVRVASFRARTLRDLRAAGYEGPTALGQSEAARLVLLPRQLWRRRLRLHDAAQIPVHFGVVRMDTRQLIDKAHALGLRVEYWTINEPDAARRLLALGADGIMTDDPGRIAPVMAERESA